MSLPRNSILIALISHMVFHFVRVTLSKIIVAPYALFVNVTATIMAVSYPPGEQMA